MTLPLFDAHCDTLFRCSRTGESIVSNSGHNDIERGMRYLPRVQVFALWSEDGDYIREYEAQLKLFHRTVRENSDKIEHCRTIEDVRSAHSRGKQAAILSVEGAEMFGCSPEGLCRAYEDGVRILNPVWNRANGLSGTNCENPDEGLTPKGKEIVGLCAQLGITVDVSHISDPGFWDIMNVSGLNVIASHSNSRTVCPHRRNLTDEMFCALVKRGMTAGINLYSEFLGPNADIGTVCDHIMHFVVLGGAKNIGIGADFDGCDSLPHDINGVEDMYKIFNALIERGLPQSTAEDIFFNNFMRSLDTTNRKDDFR